MATHTNKGSSKTERCCPAIEKKTWRNGRRLLFRKTQSPDIKITSRRRIGGSAIEQKMSGPARGTPMGSEPLNLMTPASRTAWEGATRAARASTARPHSMLEYYGNDSIFFQASSLMGIFEAYSYSPCYSALHRPVLGIVADHAALCDLGHAFVFSPINDSTVFDFPVSGRPLHTYIAF